MYDIHQYSMGIIYTVQELFSYEAVGVLWKAHYIYRSNGGRCGSDMARLQPAAGYRTHPDAYKRCDMPYYTKCIVPSRISQNERIQEIKGTLHAVDRRNKRKV